jgi:hypothetical protein
MKTNEYRRNDVSSRSLSRDSNSSSKSSNDQKIENYDSDTYTKTGKKIIEKVFKREKNLNVTEERPSNSNTMNVDKNKNIKKFDKIFGKKGSNKDKDEKIFEEQGKLITAPEGSVEYWNQMREKLGMKKLKS